MRIAATNRALSFVLAVLASCSNKGSEISDTEVPAPPLPAAATPKANPASPNETSPDWLLRRVEGGDKTRYLPGTLHMGILATDGFVAHGHRRFLRVDTGD